MKRIELADGGGASQDTTVDTQQAYEEAIEWFADRLAMPPEEWAKLDAWAKAEAFGVSAVTRYKLVQELQDSLTKAMTLGWSLDQWKETVGPLLDNWGTEVKDAHGRLETIYRTNLQRAYSYGRYEASKDPVIQKLRPYWIYDAVIDGRTTKGCRGLHGVCLPQDDPFWDGNYPPRHFRCRAIVRSVSKRKAEQHGITKPAEKPDVETPEGFGKFPTLRGSDEYIDKQRELAEKAGLRWPKPPKFEPPTKSWPGSDK